MVTTCSPHIAIIGAGFIGKHLIRQLLKADKEVWILDRNDCPPEFMHAVTWIKGDFHDHAALAKVLHGASIAYHLVSSTVPGDQHIDIAWEWHENVVGSLRLVDVCIAEGVKRLIYASSASVYGVQEHFPVSEVAQTWPISTHGIHKLTVEKFLWLVHREQNLDVRIVRLANPYGPGQSITGRQGFVAIAIGCLLRGGGLTLRDEGRMVRDFIYVEDVSKALVSVGLLDGLPTLLNIGSGKGNTLREVLDVIERLSGCTIKTLNAPSRPVDIPVSVLDISCARDVIGFSPQVLLEQGIANTLHANSISLRDSMPML